MNKFNSEINHHHIDQSNDLNYIVNWDRNKKPELRWTADQQLIKKATKSIQNDLTFRPMI